MAAMSRQRMPAAQRRDFWCYMDEFQNFITPSMAEILAGARKYRLGLILAHQELRHLESDRDVGSAVLSNCYTRVVFKIGDADARALESGFSHFEARDLMNLRVGETVCRVERSDSDFNIVVPNSPSPGEAHAALVREAVIGSSRAKYAVPRSEVEAALFRKAEHAQPKRTEVPKQPKAPAAAAAEEAPQPVSEGVPLPLSATAGEKQSVEELHPTQPDGIAAVPSEVVAQGVSELPATHAPLQSVSETPPAIAEAVAPIEPKAPTEIGRGSTLHRDTQRRIKLVAEELGFRATMEAQVGSAGVDLLLERDQHRIAVEFSASTGVTHETQNVLKCLVGDYTHIALVSADAEKLQQVATKFRERVAETEFARLGFYEVEPFLEHLRSHLIAAVGQPKKPKAKKPLEKKIMGWNVTSEVADQTLKEQHEAKARTLNAIGDALRKNKEQ